MATCFHGKKKANVTQSDPHMQRREKHLVFKPDEPKACFNSNDIEKGRESTAGDVHDRDSSTPDVQNTDIPTASCKEHMGSHAEDLHADSMHGLETMLLELSKCTLSVPREMCNLFNFQAWDITQNNRRPTSIKENPHLDHVESHIEAAKKGKKCACLTLTDTHHNT